MGTNTLSNLWSVQDTTGTYYAYIEDDGVFYASGDLQLGGTAYLAGGLTVGGNTALTGSLSVMGLDALRVAEVTIPTASVKTLNATPYELLAAPAAGYYHQVLSIHWFLDFASAAYDAAAAGDTLNAKYTDGAGAAVVDAVAGDAIGAAAADYHTIVTPPAELIPVAAAAVVAHIATGEWYAAAGDSPLKARIVYRTVELAF